MGTDDMATCHTVLCSLLLITLSFECLAADLDLAHTAVLEVNMSWVAARKIPQTLFGVFFEVRVLEINHAGTGGLWVELVRGFEAGWPKTSNIDPWSLIGNKCSIHAKTKRLSCFSTNINALKMEVVCEKCPAGVA
nr:alpha-L-arabinofuranosidase 1-like [Lolium perenne]